MAKKISDYVPVAKAEGMDYLLGANASGMSIQTGTISALNVGGTINIPSEMADLDYGVILVNETNGSRLPTAVLTGGTHTKTTVNYGGGVCVDADQLRFYIIGRLKNQKA